MDQADLFVRLDTVQQKKNEWQNRNGLKTAQGPQWLTVPVRFRFPARIDEVVVNDDAPWRHNHKQALVTNCRRAQAWEAEEASLDALYAETGTHPTSGGDLPPCGRIGVPVPHGRAVLPGSGTFLRSGYQGYLPEIRPGNLSAALRRLRIASFRPRSRPQLRIRKSRHSARGPAALGRTGE